MPQVWEERPIYRVRESFVIRTGKARVLRMNVMPMTDNGSVSILCQGMVRSSVKKGTGRDSEIAAAPIAQRQEKLSSLSPLFVGRGFNFPGES